MEGISCPKIVLTHLVFLLLLFVASPCLSMGTRGSVPQADAINLQVGKYYRVNPDGSFTMRLYFKTLLNTYKGKKDRGDFRFAYNSAFERVDVRLARTILPDGKIIEVGPKEINDIVDPSTQGASIFSGARVKVVNFPAVEKGCIIELELVKHSCLGFWGLESFSLADPCREKKVTIDLPYTSRLNYHIGSSKIHLTKHQNGDRLMLEWTGKQLEKSPDDPLSPPLENRPSTLIFSSFGSWQQVATWLRKRVLEKVPAIGGQSGSQETLAVFEGADALYCLLTKKLEILPIGLFQTRFKFQPPAQTLHSGYGSQVDAALLFYSLLKARGKAPELMAANARGIWIKGLRDLCSPRLFDTILVKVNKKYYSFDRKDLSPGITGMDGQMCLGLDSGRLQYITDVRPKDSSSKYEVSFPKDFVTEYRYRTRRTGIGAQGMRRMFKDLTPREFEVTSAIFFHSLNPLARPMSPVKITGLEPLAGPVELFARYQVRDFVISNATSFIFQVPRITLLDVLATFPDDRKSDLFIKRRESARVEFSMTIPESYEMISLPPDIEGSQGPVSWKNVCSAFGKRVDCVRTVKVKRGFVKKGAEFKRLRGQVLELFDPEQNCLQLRPRD